MERAPIPQGNPPSYAFVNRVYSRNLRPIVLATTVLAGFWTLFSGVGFFRVVSIYHNNGAPKVGIIALVLGILCMVVVVIEVLGLAAAITTRLLLVRLYAYLSMLVALIAAATGLLRIIVHFTLKNEILNACTNTANGQRVVYSGWWGPIYSNTLDEDEAAAFCRRYFDRDSWSLFISFFVLTALAVFFSLVALSFLRQVLDPSSAANVVRGPRQRGPNPNYPSHYNGPYHPQTDYNSFPYPGPNGFRNDAFVPPYDADGKPPGYVRGDDKDHNYGDRGSLYKGDDDEGHGQTGERDVTSPKTGYGFR